MKSNLNKTFHKFAGFTLIELLVVIGIISILIAAITINFTKAREGVRDDVRRSSLKEVQLALETYKAQYGYYPAEGCGSPTIADGDTPSTSGVNWDSSTDFTGPGPHSASWGNNTTCDTWIVGLVPEFISSLPTDPNKEGEDNVGYAYRVSPTGSSYKVISTGAVEKKTITSYGDEFARCPKNYGSGTGCSALEPPANDYAVYSAGAEEW